MDTRIVPGASDRMNASRPRRERPWTFATLRAKMVG
jgi:hypothetical protein